MLEDPADAAYSWRPSAFASRRRWPAWMPARNSAQPDSWKRRSPNSRRRTRSILAISIAEQEIKRTKEMIEREKNPGGHVGHSRGRGLTPAEKAQKDVEERSRACMPIPELKPLNPAAQHLKMNNQPVRVLYETVGKLAGINVVFDPEYQPRRQDQLHGRSFQHHPGRSARLSRHPDQVVLETAFPEHNLRHERQRHQAPRLRRLRRQGVLHQERHHRPGTSGNLDDRPVGDGNPPGLHIQRSERNPGPRHCRPGRACREADRDLDKPKAEVVIDVIVMEANRPACAIWPRITYSAHRPVSMFRSSTAQRLPPWWRQRNGDGTGNGNGRRQWQQQYGTIPLNKIESLGSAISRRSFPALLIQALMSDNQTRILQQPQVRAVENKGVPEDR